MRNRILPADHQRHRRTERDVEGQKGNPAAAVYFQFCAVQRIPVVRKFLFGIPPRRENAQPHPAQKQVVEREHRKPDRPPRNRHSSVEQRIGYVHGKTERRKRGGAEAVTRNKVFGESMPVRPCEDARLHFRGKAHGEVNGIPQRNGGERVQAEGENARQFQRHAGDCPADRGEHERPYGGGEKEGRLL